MHESPKSSIDRRENGIGNAIALRCVTVNILYKTLLRTFWEGQTGWREEHQPKCQDNGRGNRCSSLAGIFRIRCGKEQFPLEEASVSRERARSN